MANEIVLYKPNEQFQLEVQVADETVWLSQQQMVILFDSTKQNISLHINNIFKEGELNKETNVSTAARDLVSPNILRVTAWSTHNRYSAIPAMAPIKRLSWMP